MKPLALALFALAALPVLAESDDSARPKSPGVKRVDPTGWMPGEIGKCDGAALR